MSEGARCPATGQDDRRFDWPLAIGATVSGLGILWLLVALPVIESTGEWAVDLMAYRDAASRFLEGGSLYAARSLAGPFHPIGADLYLYPPPMGLSMAMLAGPPLAEAARIWYVIHVAALVGACLLMPVRLATRLLALGLAAFSYAVLRDLIVSNVSILLLLSSVMAWRWLDRPIGSVALAVMISVRASFGVVLVWQLLRRAWRPVLWTICAGGALFLASLALVGPEGYRDYLTMLGHVDTNADLNSSDLARSALALGMSPKSTWMAVAAGWLIAGVALLLSLRRDREVGYMVAIGASLLMAPLMWEHYLVLVVLPAAFLASRGHPWAIALPLLTWLPREFLAFVAIAATLLPFLANEAADRDVEQVSGGASAGTSGPMSDAPSPV